MARGAVVALATCLVAIGACADDQPPEGDASSSRHWDVSIDLCTEMVCEGRVPSPQDVEAIEDSLRSHDGVAELARFEPAQVVAAVEDLHDLEPDDELLFGTRFSLELAQGHDASELMTYLDDPFVADVVVHVDAARAVHSLEDAIAAVGPVTLCQQCLPDVSVFLCDGRQCPAITDEQRSELEATLSADDDVEQVEFESKQEAYRRFLERFHDQEELLATVTPDALPASFRLALRERVDVGAFLNRYRAFPGVEEVMDEQDPSRVHGVRLVLWLLRKATVLPN